jgi:hypothetical protein
LTIDESRITIGAYGDAPAMPVITNAPDTAQS